MHVFLGNSLLSMAMTPASNVGVENSNTVDFSSL